MRCSNWRWLPGKSPDSIRIESCVLCTHTDSTHLYIFVHTQIYEYTFPFLCIQYTLRYIRNWYLISARYYMSTIDMYIYIYIVLYVGAHACIQNLCTYLCSARVMDSYIDIHRTQVKGWKSKCICENLYGRNAGLPYYRRLRSFPCHQIPCKPRGLLSQEAIETKECGQRAGPSLSTVDCVFGSNTKLSVMQACLARLAP